MFDVGVLVLWLHGGFVPYRGYPSLCVMLSCASLDRGWGLGLGTVGDSWLQESGKVEGFAGFLRVPG
jgi:hypothetical protein